MTSCTAPADGALEAGSAGDGPRESITAQDMADTPCVVCSHRASAHSLGGREGRCESADCPCREPLFDWFREDPASAPPALRPGEQEADAS